MGEAYNKGEWSEFYVFIKILAERQLLAADPDLNPLEGVYYPVQKVLRNEPEIERTYDLKNAEIISLTLDSNGGTETHEFNSSDINNFKDPLLQSILNGKGSFEIAEAESMADTLRSGRIKAASTVKGDIIVVIHDYVTNLENCVEFSIKSYLGNTPTLLNASRATNFKFLLEAFNGSIDEINSIDGRSKVRDRMTTLCSQGTNFKLVDMASSVFKRNLRKLDSSMPQFVGQYLLYFFAGKANTISDLTRIIVEEKASYDGTGELYNFEDLKYKMKQLLINVALGLVPNTDWDGFIKADGGYIIIKHDGEVVCFHIYNISELGEYLFNNTKLETASTGRHKFAAVYSEGDQFFMNLNLQIRFI